MARSKFSWSRFPRSQRLRNFLATAWVFSASFALVSLLFDAFVWRKTIPDEPSHRAVVSILSGVLIATIFNPRRPSEPHGAAAPPDSGA